MAIKTTRWAPDTCGCIFEYTWDSAISERNRTHSFQKIVRACSAHAILKPANTPLESAKVIYDAVINENKTKNIVLLRALETHPELADFIEPETGKRLDAISFADQVQPTARNTVSQDYGLGLAPKEDVTYERHWVEDKQQSPDKPRTLEVDFKIPKITEVLNPQRVARARSMQSDLQTVLDKEFGKGKIKVKKS